MALRFLDSEKGPNDLTALSFSNHTLSTLRRLLKAPHGMILTTGPTGSGKTTTLYAALQELNLVERKIITLEDPIEYRLENINQIQINPKVGLNFATLLRSVLRQDPDIIMVGEIRDEETADIAVRASLTGHLVLTTMHTNTPLGSFDRLNELGIDRKMLTSSVICVVGQTLEKNYEGDERSGIFEIIDMNGKIIAMLPNQFLSTKFNIQQYPPG